MSDIAKYMDLQFAEMLSDGLIVYSTGDAAKLLYANKAALDIFGCENLEDMVRTCRGDYLNFFHPEDYRHHADTARLAWGNEDNYEFHAQYRVVTKSGAIKMLSDSGKAIDIPGQQKCYLCVLTEIDHHEYFSLGTTDQLTGLLSLGQFIQYCENFLHTHENRDNAKFYNVVFFNIRRFKDYNVEFGSKKGDFVLQTLGRIITKWSRTHVVARMGGDQFVAFSGSDELEERIQNVIDDFTLAYGKDSLSIDVGVYRLKDYREDIHTACDLAKVACDSIRSEKETVCFYDERLSNMQRLNNYVIHHFDEALEKRYIKVYYQPVMRTMTGEQCGMEALARWVDPHIGFLSPSEFIPVLEDNHLITRLDLYMLESICDDMKDAEAHGRTLVPISFNLSRIDFIDCDIFAEVEAIVKRFGVPRDMLNVEITESMVMGDADLFTKEIARFREGGYQVWMDDFGSGYSSLNILQNFRFDEIKLDMRFLASFNNKTKTIIESIVMMAKKIGVQTLAEGVENEEQLAFLRSIGCEKAQGYLFGRPMPRKELAELIDNRGVHVEERKWRKYQDEIGKVSIITDKALAITEFDGKNFEYLYVNPAFRGIWKSLGATDMDVVYDTTNSESSPLGRQLRELQRVLRPSDDVQTITASVNGQYIRLNIKCITEHENKAAYATEIINLTNKEERDKREQLDKVFRMMYSLYDAIYLLELDRGIFQPLMHGASSNLEDYKRFHEEAKLDFELAGKIFIHPSEREEYAKFCDLTTLVDRLKATERGYIVHYFRTLTANGAYKWKIHTLLYIPNTNSVIYCSRVANFDQPGLIEKVAPEHYFKMLQKGSGEFGLSVRRGVLESRTLNLFWKDADRRFVGANESFLNTYGFSDVSAIVGKTDEEMGWHVENDPFKDDELRVLGHGDIIVNRMGTCIIKGVVHNIIINKEPLYDDGKIVGILGSFIIADELRSEEGSLVNANTTDPLTGLMTAPMLLEYTARYVESFRLYHENFAVIRITLSEYFRVNQTYGEKIANAMLREISQILLQKIGVRAVLARLFAGNFVMVSKCKDKDEIRAIADEIEAALEDTHELAGYPVTLNPKKEIHFADEAEDIHTILGVASGGTAVDLAERRELEKLLQTYNLQMNTIIDAIPGGVTIHEMHKDGSFDIVYASAGVAQLTGRATGEYKSEISAKRYEGMFPEDKEPVDQAVHDAVYNDKPLDVNFRLCHKDGHVLWINMKGRLIGEQDGNPLLLVVYQNISHTAKDHAYENVIEALTRDYLNVFEVDTKTGMGETIKLEGHITNGMEKNVGVPYPYQTVVERYVDERVHPEDREKLRWLLSADGIEESLDGTDEFSMPYRVLAGGKMHYFSAKIIRKEEENRYIVAFQSIDSLTDGADIALEKKQRATLADRYGDYFKHNFDPNSLSQVLSVAELQGAMLTSIASSYISMHIVNLEDYTFMKIWCLDYVDEVLRGYTNAQEALDQIIKVMVAEESQEEARVYFDLSTLPERLKDRKVLQLDYNGTYTGWCRGLFIPVTFEEDGRPKETLFISQYIQEEKAKEERLVRLSETDGLSQLYNHIAGELHVNEYLENGGDGMFCLLDIDNFKCINDTYGHVAGDKVIRGISHCMRETFREEDILMRLGGDEFGIFAPGLVDRETCDARVEALAASVEALVIEDVDAKITISIGVAIHDKGNGNAQFDQLYRESDGLMYEQKRNKRNCKKSI